MYLKTYSVEHSAAGVYQPVRETRADSNTNVNGNGKLVLRDYQVIGRDWLVEKERAFLTDWPGLGKGGRPEDSVLTPVGWRKYKSLIVGDKVIGLDGTACTITGVYHRGTLPMYRIIFSDGVDITVSEDHLWTYTKTYFFNGRVDREFTGDTKSVKKLVDSGTRRNRVFIPLVKPVKFNEVDNELDSYTLGVLLGDGSFRHHLMLSTNDTEILDSLSIGTDVIKHVSRYDYRINGGHTKSIIKNLGLWNLYSHEKFVPHEYKFSSVVSRLSLLQGIMDTDGDIRKDGTVQFCTTSEQLAKDTRFIIQSLGGLARINFKDTTSSDGMPGRMAYILTIAMPDGINPFRLSRKAYAHKNRVKYKPTRYINSIERVQDSECICIAVDAPDKLYVTEHCIVTHNTLQAAEAAIYAGGLPCIVTAPSYLTEQWYSFLCKQYPHLKVRMATGATMHRFDRQARLKSKADIYVVNHDMWRKGNGIQFPDAKTIIVDECHHFRNRTAMRSKGLAEYAADMSKKIYMLSATPMWKDTDDIWMQLHILQPEIFTSYRDFIDTFCIVDDTQYGPKVLGIKRTMRKELESLLSILMFGRSYKDVGRVLPTTIETYVTVEFPKPLREHYERLRKQYRVEIDEDQDLILSYYLQVLRLLRMLTNFGGKQEAAIERISDVDKPTLSFVWYKDTAYELGELMKKRFGKDNVYVLTGDIPAQERQRLAHKAQTERKHIIATESSLGEGVNLYEYRHVLFYEEDWPPGRNYQALSRVVRDRNDDGADQEPVLVSYVHVTKTVDEVVHRSSKRRSSNIKEVMKEILL